MYRIFTALALPGDIRDQLASMCLGLPGLLWVDPGQLHLTVRYIGQVDGGQFEDIRHALDHVPVEPFEVTLEGIGFFPLRRRPETVWAGVQKSEPLLQLRSRIDSAVRPFGVSLDTRKFLPYVTIGRFGPGPVKNDNPQRLGAYLAEFSLFRSRTFEVDRFGLYSSVRSSAGPSYLPEAWYPPDLEGEDAHEALS